MVVFFDEPTQDMMVVLSSQSLKLRGSIPMIEFNLPIVYMD